MDANQALALLDRFHRHGITWVIMRVAESESVKSGYQVSLSWSNAGEDTMYSAACDTLADAVVDVVAQMAGRSAATKTGVVKTVDR